MWRATRANARRIDGLEDRFGRVVARVSKKGRVDELNNRGHGSTRLLYLTVWLSPYGFAASEPPGAGRE